MKKNTNYTDYIGRETLSKEIILDNWSLNANLKFSVLETFACYTMINNDDFNIFFVA
jgi:hypothetical protein